MNLSRSLLCAALAGPLAAQQFSADPLQGFPSPSSTASGMVLADLDDDGDLDLVFGVSGGQNRLFLGDGHGAFTDGTSRLPVDKDLTQAVAAGDVDGDGDADLVFGNFFAQNRLYLNANGTFTDATAGRLPASSDGTQALAFFDAEGDGDLDLLVGNQNQVNALLRNDGKGVFTDVSATQMPSDQDNTEAVAALDIDGDKDIDLLIGNDRNGNHLLLNDGKGGFTRVPSSSFPLFGDATFGLAAGDVDGDQRPDVFFANGLGPNRLYLNQGGGRFVDSPKNLPANNSSASFGVALGDVDGDGDLDAAIANSFAQNELWLNDGKGVFTDATARLPQVANATSAALLADLDQDGDLDLVFGNGGGPALFANHLRHLSATGVLQLGNTWTLQLARRAGFATGPSFAVPAVAPGDRIAPVPVPGLGNLLIDARVLILLPRPTLGSPAGTASLPLPIPNDPALRNQRLSVQAVVADSANPADAHLTNAVVAVLR